MTHATTVRSENRHAGYTIIEMMIVMVILIVVMALVVPVIGSARNTAKKTNTQQLLSNLAQASQQFELSERRMPGYFTPTEMGSVENGTRGFGDIQNVILELSGGIVADPGLNPAPDPNDPDDLLMGIGPVNNPLRQVVVRRGLIGAPVETKGVVNKGYFIPDPKYFVAQSSPDNQEAILEHRKLPVMIDDFGQPFLAWHQDADPSSNQPFAAVTSATRASFYWNSNSGFLKAKALGRKAQDQRPVADGDNGSMLSERMPANAVLITMQGLLGHPAAPRPKVNASDPDVPAAARGKLVFHSAGLDGVYLSIKDRGGIIGTASGSTPPGHVRGAVDYRSGQDPLDNFDDIISAAGN